ncbi:MAG: aldo/keto reductase [Cyclobacteriaceae bacterium]|nr:aldo/keto reductase [Cyclobacteriaceae bacterium]
MKEDRISRRKFISKISVGTGGILLAGAAETTAGLSTYSTDPFQTITLGKSGIKTSMIGMGTGVHGGNRECNMTRAGREKGIALIQHAYDRGIRMFDGADLYGTHPFIAEALKSKPREDYILVSKIWVRPGGIPEPERPDADVVVDRFRKELNTDHIDIMQIHCMVDQSWTDQQKKQMDILQNLKDKGIIKSHGVSIHSLDALNACITSPWVDIVHTRVNAFGAVMDDKDPQNVISVVKKIHDAKKGVIAMKLIGGGKFNNDPEKIEQSLKYVLESGAVDLMIVGFEEKWQIDNYAERVENALKTINRS